MASDVTVTPDQVSIGVLVSSVPRDVIDAAVAARGVGVKRSGGTLPAHVVVYLTLALCLFPDDDYTEVATKVTGSLSRFGCWDASWRVPTSSGITQARRRVGSAVLADVFEGVAQPVATMSTRGAWLRRWRLLAIDGFDADLSDSDANVAEFGYAGSGGNRSAFPKARVVALAECGTHAFVAAEVDAWSVGEKTLAAKLYPRLRRDELLTADRNFYSFDAWSVAVRTGAALLWRAPRSCGAGPARTPPPWMRSSPSWAEQRAAGLDGPAWTWDRRSPGVCAPTHRRRSSPSTRSTRSSWSPTRWTRCAAPSGSRCAPPTRPPPTSSKGPAGRCSNDPTTSPTTKPA